LHRHCERSEAIPNTHPVNQLILLAIQTYKTEDESYMNIIL